MEKADKTSAMVMDDDTKEIIRDFLSHSDRITESLYAELDDTFGKVPFIMKLLSEKKEQFIFNGLGDLYTGRPESLDPKTAEIATIAAAAACGADKCLGFHIEAALKSGITREQILDTILIGAMINRTRSLATSLRVFEERAGKPGDQEP